MNVLIIPEDFRQDQYILKPIIEKMFAEIGKSRATIEMCMDPLLGGIDQATDWERIRDILEMYPMVHVFLLLVDRDGVDTRRLVLDRLEKKRARRFDRRPGPIRGTCLARNRGLGISWSETAQGLALGRNSSRNPSQGKVFPSLGREARLAG